MKFKAIVNNYILLLYNEKANSNLKYRFYSWLINQMLQITPSHKYTSE